MSEVLPFRAEEERIELVIERANRGDAEAGRDLLRECSTGLMTGHLSPKLADYLSDCLWSFVQDGIPLERALNVETDNVGGRPEEYDLFQVIATDVLLRRFAGMGKEAAAGWIEDEGGPKKRTVQTMRTEADLAKFESLDRDLLLHTAGRYAQKLVGVISEA